MSGFESGLNSAAPDSALASLVLLPALRKQASGDVIPADVTAHDWDALKGGDCERVGSWEAGVELVWAGFDQFWQLESTKFHAPNVGVNGALNW